MYHARDFGTLQGRVRIPPDGVFDLFAVNDGVVVTRLPFVGAARVRFGGCEVLPVDLCSTSQCGIFGGVGG